MLCCITMVKLLISNEYLQEGRGIEHACTGGGSDNRDELVLGHEALVAIFAVELS